jgi:hypothetical protein
MDWRGSVGERQAAMTTEVAVTSSKMMELEIGIGKKRGSHLYSCPSSSSFSSSSMSLSAVQ